MYVEAYNVIKQALTQPEVNFNGKYYNFENVPIEMKPAQLPHPPFWYAVPVPEGAVWPAQNRINIVCGGPLPRVREITDRYRAEWAAAGNSPDDIPLLGINRFVVAADTDREAMELGRRAWPLFYASFMKLWNKHGTQPRYARIPEDFDTMVKNGGALAGSARHDPRPRAQYGGARRARAISSRSFPSATCRIRRCCTPQAYSPARCYRHRRNAKGGYPREFSPRADCATPAIAAVRA